MADNSKNPFDKRKQLDQEIDELNKKLANATGKELDRIIAKINKLVDKFNSLSKDVEEWNDSLSDTFENFEDIDDELRSIGSILSENSSVYKVQSARIEKSKEALQTISSISKSNLKINDEDRKKLIKIGDLYKENVVSVANINKQYADGEISLEQLNSLIEESAKRYRDATASIELSKEALDEVGLVLRGMNKEVKSFGDFAKTSSKNIKELDNIFDSFSGLPAMRELNTLIKTNVKDTLAFKAAAFALGAVLAKTAYDYLGAPIKANLQASKEIAQNRIDSEAEVAKLGNEQLFISKKLDQERSEESLRNAEQVIRLQNEANFAAERSAMEFNYQMKQGALQFQAAAKTALFGKGLGSVNYGAAQLQLAGISAETIAQQISEAGNIMGKIPSSKVASDMAVLAKSTGQSGESIAQLTKMFMTTENVTEKQALNLTEGLRAMADSAKIPLDSFMSEISEASKDMLSYQIKSAPALAKQVAYAKSLGISFSEIAKAGQNMVLNYKDSIKSEMQLSALLGRQVDLSEVRAKFAAGDQKGALLALKAQGLNPAEMDMFQQQALTQATGIDLASLQKIATGTGAQVNELAAGNVNTANKSFLGRTQAAEAQLQSSTAVLSANQAILDAQFGEKVSQALLNNAKLRTALEANLKSQNSAQQEAAKLASEMDRAWRATEAYTTQIAKTSQLETERSALDTLIEGTISLAGGAVFTKLSGTLLKKFLPSSAAGGGLTDILTKILPGGGGTGTAGAGGGVMQTAGQVASKAGPVAAAAAGFVSIFQGIKNVATSDALTAGSGLQDFGNTVANVGASFVNILDKATFGLTKMAAEAAGVSIKGVRTDLMENARGAYRAMTGQQIGIGEESNQKLIDWVVANKDYLKGAGGLPGTVQAFETAIAEGKIKTSANSPAASVSDSKAAANVAEKMVEPQTSVLTQIKNNDDIRGKLMYGQDKLQTSYLSKSLTRHHTSMQVLETQLTIMKQTRDLQEIAVEFLAELLKKQEVSPKVTLDGKVLNSKLFDRGQRDRIIA